LGLPATIEFPGYADEEQHFPFRTLIMIVTFIVHIFVSKLSHFCFSRGWLDAKFDVLHCFPTTIVSGVTSVAMPLVHSPPPVL
jgi:hypothetical protein